MTSRPVWFTREQLDQAVAAVLSEGEVEDAKRLQAAWDAAPADAINAVKLAIDGWPGNDIEAGRVLRALGCPDPEPHA